MIIFSSPCVSLWIHAWLRHWMIGIGRKRAALSHALFIFPLTRSRYQTARTQVCHAHVRNTRRKRILNTRENVGRDLLAWIENELDQRPPRESSIVATKRERTRPLVFIRVPHCPPRTTVSLFRGASPTASRRTRVREDTHEIWPILILVSGRRNLYMIMAVRL